jgi:hypothetical protein
LYQPSSRESYYQLITLQVQTDLVWFQKKKSLKVVTKKTILFEEAGLFGLLHLSVYKERTIMRSFEQGRLDVPPFNKTKSQTKI